LRGKEVNMTNHLTGSNFRVADYPGVGPDSPRSSVSTAADAKEMESYFLAMKLRDEF